jgi:hypothetical protein
MLYAPFLVLCRYLITIQFFFSDLHRKLSVFILMVRIIHLFILYATFFLRMLSIHTQKYSKRVKTDMNVINRFQNNQHCFCPRAMVA